MEFAFGKVLILIRVIKTVSSLIPIDYLNILNKYLNTRKSILQ